MLNKVINSNLSTFEKEVMFNKATEAPFTGEYDNFFEEGIFVCRNCDTPLYSSSSKFNSGCGWPAFDAEITTNNIKTVKQVLDKDGRRVEILCNNCGIHLGHVFKGEWLTKNNVRYCVNSASIKFVASKNED